MSRSISGRTAQPRTALVAGLLLLTLLFTALLAYQAFDAARSHRAAAERALHDYAAFGAQEMVRRSRDAIGDAFTNGVLRPVTDFLIPTLASPLPPASALARRPSPPMRGYDVVARGRVRGYFRYVIKSGMFTTTDTVSPAFARWARDTLAVHLAALQKLNRYSGIVFGSPDGRPSALVYQVRYVYGATPVSVAAYGVELAPEDLAPIFAQVFAGPPLLPPSMVHGARNDSLLSVDVAVPRGLVLYRSGTPLDPRLAAADSVGVPLGSLVFGAAVRPEAAARLVIGGLPASRLPLLAGLLTLTAALTLAAMVQLRREAQLARLRTEFVANVSHELRTPLAQIRMFAETLLLGRVRNEDERRRSLEIVDQEARRLTHLVENMLQFSRAERGESRLTPEPTPLGALARAVVEGFAPLAAARRTRVVLNVDDAATALVDRDAARQILLNLLDNAVKYGPPGQTVTVEIARQPAAVRITVTDQGPGIPADARAWVWQRFSRLERPGDAAGTGIGLAVVRELVARQGGTCSIADAPGGGARFIIDLPSAAPA